ncbi:hypothetical protein ACFLZX_01640 [Nanoarchaeota archaeon]
MNKKGQEEGGSSMFRYTLIGVVFTLLVFVFILVISQGFRETLINGAKDMMKNLLSFLR